MNKFLKGYKFPKGNIPWNKDKKLSKEHKNKLSLNHADFSGKNNPMYGKKHTPESIIKTKKSMKKIMQSPIIREKISNSLKGRKSWNKDKTGIYSLETIQKMKLSHIGKFKGEKSHFWKGGITPLIMQIRNSFNYRQWRINIFTKDKFTCKKCGQKGGELNAHHIKPFAKIIEENQIGTMDQSLICEELWDINNGITLCLNCHYKL